MSRPIAFVVLAATTLACAGAAICFYLDNRELRAELAARDSSATADLDTKREPTTSAAPRGALPPIAARAADKPPELAAAPSKEESRMERRTRNTQDFAARFGRLPGETEDEYRARVFPLMQLALVAPRMRAAEMRRVAEEKANVTPAQSAALDKAFEKVYEDVLDYTNKAISDGQLSPYERNVAGWLDFAGGLGGLLSGANGQIGKILEPGQVKAMYEAGFEWGEYLGLQAPWERLNPPPPPPQ
jgi:hypothetical protein